MSKNITQLQKRVMRRVYYTFTLRAIRHTVTVQAGLFVVALLTFGKMVHVRMVTENMFSTPLGNVPEFIFNAMMRGEVLTLIAIGVMTFVVLSLGRRVLPSGHTHESERAYA